MKKEILDAFNAQIKAEMESAYLYLAMAAYFDAESLDGFSAWMKAQAIEEMGHAMRFYQHIIDRDGTVEFEPLGIKKARWDSALEVFTDTLEHERYVTSRIDDLVQLTQEHRDRAGRHFLEWFVEEQIEEEATASKVLTDIKRVGDSGHGLLMIDRELGQRQIALPTAGEES
ncbi:MAG: ferritin [Deltaproteobacteria bacterium]|nr:ferritin [Deltaproteobacteria bacterium]